MTDNGVGEPDEETGAFRERRATFSERPTLNTPIYRKKSISHDIATGKEDFAKDAFVAEIRSPDDRAPRRRSAVDVGMMVQAAKGKLKRSMSQEEERPKIFREGDTNVSMHGRLMVQRSTYFNRKGCDDVAEEEEFDDEEKAKGKGVQYVQYRLSKPKVKPTCWPHFLGFFGISPGTTGIYDEAGGGMSDDGCKCCGVSPNNIIIMYLNWAFRAPIIAVLFSGALGFFSLTLIFAAIILGVGRNKPDCITVNGYYFNGTASDFADAYALSWTTFSTVGYGLVYPSTSASHLDSSKTDCAGIQMLCTLESFVGILFASFCGAIIIGKISRIRSFAQVEFSDPIVIRYGSGVVVHGDDDDDDEGSTSSNGDGDNPRETRRLRLNYLPPPVLEFRVINRLHSTQGGEIMDATMNIVASIEENQGNTSSHGHATRRRRRKGRRGGRRHQSFLGALHGPPQPAIPETSAVNQTATIPRTDSELSMSSGQLGTTQRSHLSIDEDPGGRLVPRKIFTKLEIESPDHPFFKRVWTARHVLDQTSPLLTTEARKSILHHRGHWPPELNNYEGVRASIRFDQILVSISGTCNSDANSVYAQKIYDYIDMNVGYRFVNLLYRDAQGSLRVDPQMINDVVEQNGGGAEPFHVINEENRLRDMTM